VTQFPHYDVTVRRHSYRGHGDPTYLTLAFSVVSAIEVFTTYLLIFFVGLLADSVSASREPQQLKIEQKA